MGAVEFNDANPILTKDKFWAILEHHFPKGTKHFYAWIDEYKKRNNWNKLFNAGHQLLQSAPEYKTWNTHTTAPKVHELPAAMQIGIFLQYTQEVNRPSPLNLHCKDMPSIRGDIYDWFEDNESHV